MLISIPSKKHKLMFLFFRKKKDDPFPLNTNPPLLSRSSLFFAFN